MVKTVNSQREGSWFPGLLVCLTSLHVLQLLPQSTDVQFRVN